MTRLAQGFASPLADGIAQFVAHKRVLGRRYDTEVYALRLFDRHLVAQRITKLDAITPVVIEAFLAARPRVRPRSYNHLLGVLRRLFRWLVARGHLAHTPVLCPVRRRASAARIPFILSPESARRLLDLSAGLPNVPGVALRGPTYRTIFALLYGLGLRVGEVCRLDVADVDNSRKLLVIRDTKFGKDRLVPFGPRLGAMLEHYLTLRRGRDRHLATDAPLVGGLAGGRLQRQQIGKIFRGLLPALGLTVPPGTSPPRLHDLRHSFAVRTLLRWYRAGVDPAQRLLHLSTFMGHVQPESTAVYLTITSDLLAEAGYRFEVFARPLVEQVRR
jgi:site-specific recombinase XerD